MNFAELIKDVLNFHGFVIESDTLPIRARKGEEIYTVILVKTPHEMELIEHMKIDGRLLVISLDDSINAFGDEFWDRKTFENMVGKAVLSKMTGEKEKPSGSVIGSFEDAFVEHREPVASPRGPDSFKDILDEAFSSTQELHPFYTYYFDIDDPEYLESGILLVNGLEGRVFRARDSITCDTGTLSSIPRIEPRIKEDEAIDTALDFLVKEHTREEDVVKEEGTVTVVEKKIIGIDEDKISLRFLGITYIPILKIEGAEGVLEIDMSGITRD